MIFRDSYKNKCTEKLKTGIGLMVSLYVNIDKLSLKSLFFPNLFTLISTSFHQEKE